MRGTAMNARAARALFLVGILLGAPGPCLAVSPAELLTTAFERSVKLFEDQSLSRRERLARLKTTLYPIFDFAEMAKRSLGPHWRDLSLDQRQEFTALFQEFLSRIYAAQLERYDNQQTILSERVVDGDYAEVESEMFTRQGRQHFLRFHLVRSDDQWKVYDIMAGNVSLIDNYRSQFQRVLTNSSYEDLIDMIRQKAQ